MNFKKIGLGLVLFGLVLGAGLRLFVINREASAEDQTQDTSINESQIDSGFVYISDTGNNLFRLNVAGGAVDIEKVGHMNLFPTITDIALSPTGELWGMDWTTIYKIDKETAAITPVGSHGIDNGNALVFSSSGVLYAAGAVGLNKLYTINLATGQASAIAGSMGTDSGGDLSFYNGHLYLAGSNGKLVRLENIDTNVSAVELGAMGPLSVFGLAPESSGGRLLAFAGNSMYQADTISGKLNLLSSLVGIGDIWGATMMPEIVETPSDGSCHPVDTQWHAQMSWVSPPTTSIPLSTAIQGGKMYVPPQSNAFWTGFGIDLPRFINGDNVRMDMRIKAPISEGAIPARDPIIGIEGTSGGARVQWMADSWGSSWAGLYAGETSVVGNVSGLVQNFDDWHVVSLLLRNHTVSVYYDSQLEYSMPYSGSIGTIKTLGFGFKGSGSADWVRVYEDDTLVFDEEFNTDGQTTASVCGSTTLPPVNQLPVITINETDPLELTVGEDHTFNVTATDSEDGDISDKIIYGGSYDPETTIPGNYTKTFTVTDSGGMTATKTLQIIVKEAVNRAPLAPANLSQGTIRSSLIVGATIDLVNDGNTVSFMGDVSDPDGDKVKLQVEVKLQEEMDGISYFEWPIWDDLVPGSMHESEFVKSGEQVFAYAEVDVIGQYRWRARTVDEHGLASVWVDFGGNGLSDVDFETVAADCYTIKVGVVNGVGGEVYHVKYELPQGEQTLMPFRGNRWFYDSHWHLMTQINQELAEKLAKTAFVYEKMPQLQQGIEGDIEFVNTVIDAASWHTFADALDMCKGSIALGMGAKCIDDKLIELTHSPVFYAKSISYGGLLTMDYDLWRLDVFMDQVVMLDDESAERIFHDYYEDILVTHFLYHVLEQLQSWDNTGWEDARGVLSNLAGEGADIVVSDEYLTSINMDEIEALSGDNLYQYIFWYKRSTDGQLVALVRDLLEGSIVTAPVVSDSYELYTHYRQNTESRIKLWAMDIVGNKREFTPLNSETVAQIHSPGELRVYDSAGKLTGLVDGEAVEEIPYSFYDKDRHRVVIFNPTDAGSLRYEVMGIEKPDETTYGLTITSATTGGELTFDAADIPIVPEEVHGYSVNWQTLSQGEDGVTMQIDKEGDGVFEKTVVADKTLEASEIATNDSVISTNTGGGGGGIYTATSPTDVSAVINNGESVAENAKVNLTLSASGAVQMAISNSPDFADVGWEDFKTAKEWVLSAGVGEKTVYVKFRSANGGVSAVVSDIINLTEGKVQGVATVNILDGDIIQCKSSADPFAVYIVKTVGDKKYIRHIVSLEIFNHYGHLKWGNIIQVDSLDGYSLSSRVRISTGPNATSNAGDKVYEINGDQTRHWMNMTAERFLNRGGSDAAIYSINQGELDLYGVGADVTL